MTHTGHKPFKCSEYNKCFSRKGTLKQHKMTGCKPFKCSECDSFRQAANLQQHKMTHTGHKPFNCSECGKCFRQKRQLELHNMTHTKDKTFSVR
ncbi:gastrula zinc finger protein XlCGF7.1-like [Microcaecilia unicolor]|uniref:Gastrula zinc finger protein XlCGF7.1-like n=1 Tax=Microcaecilia unicolor TaxID=1415580 RepID=A0A6P7XLT2_9AMPH|nr:gastrula zinc finger protein XlCGF7.1-like [Microcaecilia unicolor]